MTTHGDQFPLQEAENFLPEKCKQEKQLSLHIRNNARSLRYKDRRGFPTRASQRGKTFCFRSVLENDCSMKI